MKVVILPSDMDAVGCYRCMFPARQLHNQGGHEVVIPTHTIYDVPNSRKKQIEFKLGFNPPIMADLWVVQQRNERMWANNAVALLRVQGIAVVSDVDDDYINLPTYNPSFVGGHPYRRDDKVILNRRARRDAKKGIPLDDKMAKAMRAQVREGGSHKMTVAPNQHNRLHMHKTFERVDLLTTSTPHLANVYEHLNKNIKVIRNYLDWDIWATVTPQYMEHRERLLLGYLGTFSYRGPDMEVLKDVIPEILRKYPHVDFVANSDAAHDHLSVPIDRRVVVPEYGFWDPKGSYKVGEKTAVMDIGLVPLAMNAFNEGKSHLKGMEYNAAGIPFVASPTESYKDYWCDEGENGFLARTPAEWKDRISELIEDDALRREMGRLGREKAELNTYQRNWREWEDAYLDLLGDRPVKISREAISRHAVQKVSELSWMLRYLEDRPLKTVVEVGSAGGGTFWSFCQIADDDALLISIDMVSGSPLDKRGDEDVYSGRDREGMYEMAQGNQRVVLLDGNSQEEEMRDRLLEVLQGRKIDFLFLDADHRYQGVKRDFELYAPLVAPGGTIGFHDIDKQNSQLAQVEKFWKEVKRNYESRECFGKETWGWGKWGGIGLLTQEGSWQADITSVRGLARA